MARFNGTFVRTMYIIGYAGLVPFAAALLATIMPNLNPFSPMLTERATLGYGVMLLGFLGGVRWGLVLRHTEQTAWTLLASCIGALLGLLVLFSPYQLGLSLLIVGFGGQGAWDVLSAYRNDVPGVYARLRRTLTLLLCVLLIVLFAAHALFPIS